MFEMFECLYDYKLGIYIVYMINYNIHMFKFEQVVCTRITRTGTNRKGQISNSK